MKFKVKYGMGFLGGGSTMYSETHTIKGHVGSCTGGSGDTWGILSAHVRRVMDDLATHKRLLTNPLWIEKPWFETGRVTLFGVSFTYEEFLKRTGKTGDDLCLKNAKSKSLIDVDFTFETKKLKDEDVRSILYHLSAQCGHGYGLRKDWFAGV